MGMLTTEEAIKERRSIRKFKPEPVSFRNDTVPFKSETLSFKSEPIAFKNDQHAVSRPSFRAERRDPHDVPGPQFEFAREQKRTFPGVGARIERRHGFGNDVREFSRCPGRQTRRSVDHGAQRGRPRRHGAAGQRLQRAHRRSAERL